MTAERKSARCRSPHSARHNAFAGRFDTRSLVPELNNLDIDTRADIYALGVLMYELLTGTPPFSAQELRSNAFAEMLRIIREVEPPWPSTKLSSSQELPAIAYIC